MGDQPDQGTPPDSALSPQDVTVQVAPLNVGIAMGVARVHIIPLHQSLLLDASSQIEREEYRLAVILSQTALEVFLERFFSQLLEHKGLPWLDHRDFRGQNYDITGDKSRLKKIYINLTGDNIVDAGFWKELTDGYNLRVAIVHRGAMADKIQAEQFLKSVKDMISYIKSHNQFFRE